MRRVGPYNEPWWSFPLLMGILLVILGLGVYAAAWVGLNP